mgnify:FL=1
MEMRIIGCEHSGWLRFVDHHETYGPDVIRDFLKSTSFVDTALDLGAGSGRDLGFIHEAFPQAKLYGLEFLPENIEKLKSKNIETHKINIESEQLPFADESISLCICNQFLEHTKELFWIFHEITRVLKVGRSLIIGVPNVASLHNRVGLLFGKQPTQAKSCSAHVRCFSKGDILQFLSECFPGGYSLKKFSGSQFYPFPPRASKILSSRFPTLSFSIFFLLVKEKSYQRSFLDYPSKAHLETNFKVSL